MDESDFEGTLVLEKLAEIGKIEEFFEAVDSDDFNKTHQLLHLAGIDSKTIQIVIHKMSQSD